jgi:hypothetical protein
MGHAVVIRERRRRLAVIERNVKSGERCSNGPQGHLSSIGASIGCARYFKFRREHPGKKPANYPGRETWSELPRDSHISFDPL